MDILLKNFLFKDNCTSALGFGTCAYIQLMGLCDIGQELDDDVIINDN